MAFGPFNSEISGKRIMDHLSKSVFPVAKEIQAFSLQIAGYQQGFWNSFFRSELSGLEEKYREINKKFLESYHIYQTPDELFKDVKADLDDKQFAAVVISDYMNTKNAVMPHFQNGFMLLEVMDRSLVRYSQSADQRVSTFLSLAAITISLITLILKK